MLFLLARFLGAGGVVNVLTVQCTQHAQELDVKRLTRKLTMVVDPDRPNIIRSLSESKPVALSESEDTHEVSPP